MKATGLSQIIPKCPCKPTGLHCHTKNIQYKYKIKKYINCKMLSSRMLCPDCVNQLVYIGI